MVRLKGREGKEKIRKLTISIPYGAIKRADGTYELYFHEGFQFLMVRLKAAIALDNAEEYIRFQFLMVRLKG